LCALAPFWTAANKPAAGTIFGGTLFGMLSFTLYAIGINLLPATPKVTVGGVFVSPSRGGVGCIDGAERPRNSIRPAEICWLR
jgi:hypothetical protein